MTGAESHPSLQTMERYLDASLPDFEQAALEDHLGECAECAEALHRMDALLFSGFTAKSHAAAIAAEEFQADPLANALRAAQKAYAEYANTLRGWLDSVAALWGASPSSPWGEWGVVPVHSQPDTPLEVTLQAEETRATVSVHRTSMTVIVTIHRRSTDLVLLFEKEPGGTVLAAPLQAGQEDSTVVFSTVPQGEYYLAVAPPEPPAPPPAE
jgi:anti-sigma factor RsiW